VLVFFLIVLLGLGYLLKENEQATNQLQIKLNEEAVLKQAKEARKKALFRVKPPSDLPKKLTAFDKSRQKIIVNNTSCETPKDCLLLQTNSQALGCLVAVNTTGVAILLKTANDEGLLQSQNEACQQAYTRQNEIILSCQNNTCTFAQQ
jgi:hypothetical protein